MKKASVLLLGLLSIYITNAQVWQGDYVIQNQSDVDNFSIECSCTQIEGNLSISNTSINNLEGLGELEYVSGNVDVIGNHSLQNVRLSGLDSIGGNLKVNNNNTLVDLEGLNTLKVVRGLFAINQNGGLLTLEGLDSLSVVGETFNIFNNANLTDIHIGVLLTSVGDLNISDGISANADYLISGFDGLEEVGYIKIFMPGKLGRLHGFSSLESIGAYLDLSSNSNLYEILAFENLREVVLDLNLSNCNSLLDVDAFSVLENVGRELKISACNNLTLIGGFQALRTAGDVLIQTNSNLELITGFSALEAISNNLNISTNGSLDTLDNFQKLEEVDQLTILGNANLKAILNLDSLKRVTFRLEIQSNALLEDISGLSGLEFIRHLQISSNNSLSDCCILKCYIENEVIDGMTSIIVNNTGCNSPEEILTGCTEVCEMPVGVSISEVKENELKIFPNPTSNLSQIEFEIGVSQNVTFELHSMDGQKLENVINRFFAAGRNKFEFEFGHLPSGQYLISMKLEDGRKTSRKVIVN
jgi:hypothetical protein